MWQLVSIFIDVLLPVFILVLIGYVVGPRLRLEARTLSRVAYYILVPGFVFTLINSAEVPAALAVRMILFIYAVQIGGVAVGFLVAWLLRRPAQVIAAYVLIAAFGNTGNLGLPIIRFRYGDEALLPATVYFLAMLAPSFAIAVAAANWHRGGKLAALAAVLKTPALLALLPALAVNWLDITPPLVVVRSSQLLAEAMVPTMLLTLGVQLADMGLPCFNRDVALASGIRLLAGPALALALAVPFGLAGLEWGAGVLQAGMPAAVFASIIALENDLLPDFVTTTVLFSTLASLLTLTVLLALV